jgi:hypothetical protein
LSFRDLLSVLACATELDLEALKVVVTSTSKTLKSWTKSTPHLRRIRVAFTQSLRVAIKAQIVAISGQTRLTIKIAASLTETIMKIPPLVGIFIISYHIQTAFTHVAFRLQQSTSSFVFLQSPHTPVHDPSDISTLRGRPEQYGQYGLCVVKKSCGNLWVISLGPRLLRRKRTLTAKRHTFQ